MRFVPSQSVLGPLFKSKRVTHSCLWTPSRGNGRGNVFTSAVVWSRAFSHAKTRILVFHPEVKGRCHKCPASFDGLIDIQRVPDPSLIKRAQTSVGMVLTHAASRKPPVANPPVADIH